MCGFGIGLRVIRGRLCIFVLGLSIVFGIVIFIACTFISSPCLVLELALAR